MGREIRRQVGRRRDDGVAAANAGIEVVERLAGAGGLEPERQLGDLDRFGAEVDAEEVAGEDFAVEVEQFGLTAAQGGQALVGADVLGVQEVEGRDQEGAGAAGEVKDAEVAQDALGLGGGGLGLEVVGVEVSGREHIAKQAAEEVGEELALEGLLLLGAEGRVRRGASPVLHHPRLLGAETGGEVRGTALEQIGVEQRLEQIRHLHLRARHRPPCGGIWHGTGGAPGVARGRQGCFKKRPPSYRRQ